MAQTRKKNIRPALENTQAEACATAIGQVSGSAERLIHERVRLAILSALAVNDTLAFGELKNLLEITDGNLSVHARKLEEAGYVACTKGFAGRMPKTTYAITSVGREVLERYLGHMESLIQAVRGKRT